MEERRERTFIVGRLANLRPRVFGIKHGPQRGGRGSRQEVARAMTERASGLETFTLLLQLVMTHFEEVDTEEGYTKLQIFGTCNGMPSSEFNREFLVLVSTATGSECVLSPGTDVVSEVVRISVNEQFRLSCLRCTLVRRQRTRGHTPRWMLCGGRSLT